MNSTPRRCAVVGAGFLGSALLRALPGSVAVEKSRGADAAEPATWAALGPFDVIFCCQATHGGDAAAYRRAYPGVAAALPPARVVFCSSLSAAGGQGGRAVILRAAEAAVLARGGVVARLAALYGPGRCELLRRHLSGEPQLAGEDSRLLRYLHVDDAANALLTLAEAPSGIYDVCGECFTKGEAYALMEQLTGRARSAEIAPASRRCPDDRLPDTAPLRALGWAPTHRFADFCRHA